MGCGGSDGRPADDDPQTSEGSTDAGSPDDDGGITITSGAEGDESTSAQGTGTDDGEGDGSSSTSAGSTSASDSESGSDSDSDGGTSSTGESSSSGDDGPGPSACTDVTIDSALPIAIVDDTTAAGDDFTGSCVQGRGGEDLVFEWTAPEDGTYLLQTDGSGFDTAMYVLSACDGTELACNDDRAGQFAGLELDLTSGQTILVVVDGYDSEEVGELSLEIQRENCVEPDLLGAATTATGTNANAGDDTMGSCGGLGFEVSYTYTAPATGLYEFTLFGSDYDTVLYLQAGDSCGGPELACNDDFNLSNSQFFSRAFAGLQAGESVVIQIDAFDNAEVGDYELEVSAVPLLGDCCDDRLSVGCADADVATCVCNASPACCADAWSADCVELATEECNAACD